MPTCFSPDVRSQITAVELLAMVRTFFPPGITCAKLTWSSGLSSVPTVVRDLGIPTGEILEEHGLLLGDSSRRWSMASLIFLHSSGFRTGLLRQGEAGMGR